MKIENILYKGKTKEGRWVEGNFFYWTKRGVNIPCIGTGVENGSVMGYEVIPESVGRYIEVCDMDGRKVFDNDIMRGTFTTGNGVTARKKAMLGTTAGKDCIINNHTHPYRFLPKIDKCIIVGNSFDNPDMLAEIKRRRNQ